MSGTKKGRKELCGIAALAASDYLPVRSFHVPLAKPQSSSR
jgi:hypothetical protein